MRINALELRSLTDDDILEQLSTFIRTNTNPKAVKSLIRRLSKEGKQALFYRQNLKGETIVTEAVSAQNVPAVRELLLEGLDPNSVLVPVDLIPEPIFRRVLQSVSIGRPETYQLAQLFWIHKAVIDFTKPFQRNREYFKEQRKQLEEDFRGVFNFSDPALCLCFAVHSALLLNRKGAERGKILLAKMLKEKFKSCMAVLELVSDELKHEEPIYYNAQRKKVSLSQDHFQCDLLREIFRDEALLHALGVTDQPLEEFDQSLRTREQCRDRLINRLDALVIASNSYLGSNSTPVLWY